MDDARPDPEDLSEEELGALLRDVAEPPRSWVEAAKELPSMRAGIDGVVERAQADAAYRERVLADLKRALVEEGHDPSPNRIAALRARLGG